MMKEIIELQSRDSTNTHLEILYRKDGEESKTYLLRTSSGTLRVGSLSNGRKFIDPSGGPMIIEGQKLAEADAFVKSVDFSEGFGYTITFI